MLVEPFSRLLHAIESTPGDITGAGPADDAGPAIDDAFIGTNRNGMPNPGIRIA